MPDQPPLDCLAQRPVAPADRHSPPRGIAGTAELALLARQVFESTHVDIRQYLPEWIDQALASHRSLLSRLPLPPRQPEGTDASGGDAAPLVQAAAWMLTTTLEAQAWPHAVPILAATPALQALRDAVALSSGSPAPDPATRRDGGALSTCTLGVQAAEAPWLIWLPACPDLASAISLQQRWQSALPQSVWLVTCAQGWPAGTPAAEGLAHCSHRAMHDPPQQHARLVLGHGLLAGIAGHVRRRLLLQLAETMDPRGLLWVPDEALDGALTLGWQPWQAPTPGHALLRPPRPAPVAGRARSRAAMQTQGATAVPVPTVDLSGAMRRRELRLHYQPQFGLYTGRAVGVEALLRWQHPTQGLLGPEALVQQAEASGGIHALGLWVLREACQQMARWQADGHAVDRVAVNVSALQWLRPRFVDEVLAMVAEAGLAPGQLMLELTESRPWPATPGPTRALLRCRQAGIGLSLDDFGAGHADLHALNQLPLTQMKIDGGLMHRVPGEPRAEAQVRHGARLGGQLGLEVVVEGVQRPEQIDWLRPLGVYAYQGHVGAPALEAQAVGAHFAAAGGPHAMHPRR